MSKLPLMMPLRLVALTFIVACMPMYGAVAQTGECEQAVADAQARYVEGRFDEVISTLSECLHRDDVLVTEAVAAYRLVALAYIRKGEVEEARLAIIQLLHRNPGYEPDRIRDIPSYVALVNLMKQDLQLEAESDAVMNEPLTPTEQAGVSRSWFQSNKGWILASGSAALVGVVLALTVNGGGGNGGASSLPPPPALPN